MKVVYSNELNGVTNALTVTGSLGASGSIAFQLQRWNAAYPQMDVARILLITDQTTGVVWYNPADPTVGGIPTVSSAGVLTVTWAAESAPTYDGNGVVTVSGSTGRPYYATTSDTVLVIYEAQDGDPVLAPGYQTASSTTYLRTSPLDASGVPVGDGRQRGAVVSIDRLDDVVQRLDQIAFLLVEFLAAAGVPSVSNFNGFTNSQIELL